MSDYIALRQYGPGQDPEADDEPDQPLASRPPPRRNRPPKTWRNPGVIACAAIVLLSALLALSYSITGDEQRIRPGRVVLDRGLMRVGIPGNNKELSGEHPIKTLIKQAEEKAEEMERLKSSVQTLEDTVLDYRETFGMDPPEGFEKWHKFAKSIGSTSVPSLLPEAHLSVLPYLALPAAELRDRAIKLQQDMGVFGMTLHPDGRAEEELGGNIESIEADGLIGINNTDFMVGYMSPRWDYPELLKPIIALLPLAQQPEWPLQMTLCVRDGGCRLSAGWMMEESRKLARDGRVWDLPLLEEFEAQVQSLRGWSQTCEPALEEGYETANITSTTSSKVEKSFIVDHLETMDFCQNPELLRLNGELLMESDHIMRPLAPMLGVSRPMHGADMLGTPTRAVRDQAKNIPWSEKTVRKVVWRGTLTGAFHRDRYDWRSSQRHRLSHLVGNTTSDTEAIVLVERDDGGNGITVTKQNELEMVEKWMNVGVIKEDIHNICGPGPTEEACRLDGGEQYAECPEYEASCDEMQAEYQWLDRMSLEESIPYRYRLDVDGYGWSSRWQKLLSTDSVILKSTIYPEWWTAQAIPWYHYVPLKYDYTDLWDILAYFDGSPDGLTRGHEDEAEQFAKRGVKLAEESLRWEDMQSYMLLLLLEYRRAWSEDREAASYRP